MNDVSPEEVTDQLRRVTRALPGGGEDRSEQRQMAQAIASAIAQNRNLVVQAGTGTGKTLAYLVPLALLGVRCVVATATKALQDQLAGKDLPLLASSLGDDAPTYAVLKGRANYLCMQRAHEVMGIEAGEEDDDPVEALSLFSDSEVEDDRTDGADKGHDIRRGFADDVRRLVDWGLHSRTGDRSELDFEPHPRAWAAVSTTSRECPGAFKCPSGPICFAERAKERAAEADVVVVNTHLYATDVAGDRSVLPEHDVLILDEAHEVEDVMTAGLGAELTAGRFRALAAAARSLLDRDDRELCDGLVKVADDLDRALHALAGERVLMNGSDPELVALMDLAIGRVESVAVALRRSDSAGDDNVPKRARALISAGHLAEDLMHMSDVDEDHVAWVESSGSGGRNLTLRLSPIEVGSMLAERLWPAVTAVLTSATVPPSIERRLGLPADRTDRMDMGSPFPFREHALLYCSKHLPDRRSPDFDSQMHEEIERLVLAAGGRTLALFTSWRAMRNAVEELGTKLPFKLWAQDDLPKPKLLREFTDEESSCLFATMSFWQGVDVPGASLSLVIVDRLPFPRPDDPVLQARRDRAGPGAFRVIDLPRAATLLAQGAGRLIRSHEDTGVVAVLDPRLAKAGYRQVLLQSLPPMRRSTDPEEVVSFLKETVAAVAAH
ncbi:MAG TPA: ATP-dependent DNA helicase [Acidimicrobiales bacterium]|nr:ATP-dependent DNA helicase [Acidimicrobiales bacterium]